ncbi:LOW QUALITY PROTEIN: hypothetical protein T265_13636 [Opisthorchis viverrini]|uniref:Uncharacterized protein n=1 Tax=Opisthorchis viverrini TaxID=6198 RepID=A0A074ZLH7_OPIVI|nr:LOW QUALITY PROTEIN: hypothetical protein T265_13636 [Opisthorchis viverrini]KER28183.1 LOW QUALITY PROTEIN: hypothetical protein T265_13636 [Opisthorchis viverrini]
MKTPRRFCGRQKAGGVYIHLGLKAGLLQQLRDIQTTVTNIEIQINVDGIGPITTRILSLSSWEYTVCIICDSPARAFLKQVKGPTGYYDCDYCTQKGAHIGTRVTFPSLTAPLRRDYDYRTRKQENHHIGPSPMKELNFPMIDGFPPDYTHSVCLGLVRKFLILLGAMPIGHKAGLSLESWNLLNDNIEQQSLALSIDFLRKCRGAVDLDRRKASELRQFLLYIGPVVLRDILHPDVYECFMYFSVTTFIGCSPFSQHYANFLIDVSKVAVSKFAAIFGPSHLVYNIHLFSHLINFVKLYVCLDRFSCFPYESELGHLKHYIYGPKPPAVQLYHRLSERVGLDAVERKVFLDDVGLRLRPLATAGCRRFIHMDVVFSKNFPDNCILLDSQSAVVVDFSKDTIVYQKFKTVLPFYTHVLISTDVLVFHCSDLQHTRLFASVDQTSCKCLSFSRTDTQTFPDALSAQQDALDSGHTSSAEQNDERLARQSRQKQYIYESYYNGCSAKKRLPSDFAGGSDRDSRADTTLFANIVMSTPSPKRLCTNPTAKVSSLILVRDAPSVPRDAPVICGTTNPPNSKASVISPDLANLILNYHVLIKLSYREFREDLLVAPKTAHEDRRFSTTSSSEALNEPPRPLSSMDDLQEYEEHLRDGPRYAQLEAGDVQVYVTNVLTRTLAPRLAVLLNWRGINDKEAFGPTRLAQGLIYATTEKFPNTNPRQIKEIVHR